MEGSADAAMQQGRTGRAGVGGGGAVPIGQVSGSGRDAQLMCDGVLSMESL